MVGQESKVKQCKKSTKSGSRNFRKRVLEHVYLEWGQKNVSHAAAKYFF